LTHFNKGNPEVLKNTSGEFPNLIALPLRITETQIAKDKPSLPYSQNINQYAEELANLDGEFSFHIHICTMDLSKCKVHIRGAIISEATQVIKAT
jgi:hypothetical protein